MQRNFVELDKSLTTPIDATDLWGAIDIRVVVASKKAEDSDTNDFDDDEIDADPIAPGAGPLDSYLEKPKGKGFVVFLVNGQRHDFLDETFVGRELGFKYLRARTMVIVDTDKLMPEATAQLVQGSRQGFYKGEVYSAVVSRIISVLKGDPDLKRLESEAEQEISELRSGDDAVKNKLDELIEGHHAESLQSVLSGTGPQGAGLNGNAGTGSESIGRAEFIIQADAGIGQAASGPVLVSDPVSACLRLHPGEMRTLRVSSQPEQNWDSLDGFSAAIDPAIPELAMTVEDIVNGKEISLLFTETDDFPAEDYPVLAKLTCLGHFEGHAEPRLLGRLLEIRTLPRS